MTGANEQDRDQAFPMLMRALKLPAFARYAEEVSREAEKEGWSFRRYLRHLAKLEIQERRQRRIERNLHDSELPGEKALATLNRARLPAKLQKMLPTLCDGDFVERGENILAFGLPGRGKTHLACAIGHELIQRGRRVYFTPTYALVQRLLQAKRDLALEKELTRLDRFDAVILDDIGYVQQSRDEMPGEKALATLNRARLPAKLQKMLPTLCDGDFVERGENILAFGLPGLGLIRIFGHRAKGGYGVPHEATVEAGEGDITATA